MQGRELDAAVPQSFVRTCSHMAYPALNKLCYPHTGCSNLLLTADYPSCDTEMA